MSTIRTRLDDAEQALETLEAIKPNDPSVLSARDELDHLRSQLDRLHYENWHTSCGRKSTALQ